MGLPVLRPCSTGACSPALSISTSRVPWFMIPTTGDGFLADSAVRSRRIAAGQEPVFQARSTARPLELPVLFGPPKSKPKLGVMSRASMWRDTKLLHGLEKCKSLFQWACPGPCRIFPSQSNPGAGAGMEAGGAAGKLRGSSRQRARRHGKALAATGSHGERRRPSEGLGLRTSSRPEPAPSSLCTKLLGERSPRAGHVPRNPSLRRRWALPGPAPLPPLLLQHSPAQALGL